MSSFDDEKRLRNERFKSLWLAHRRIVTDVCMKFFPKDEYCREELGQMILIRMWRNRGKLCSICGDESVSMMFYTIAHNEACRYYKKWHNEVDRFRNMDKYVEEYEEEECDDDQLIDDLYEMIDCLGNRDKEILLMYMEKHTLKEIASVMGITFGATAMRIHRLKEKLKDMNKKNNSL